MRNVRRDVMTILLLLVSGFGCTTIPRNAGPPPVEGGPGETLKRLSALMQTPSEPRQAGVPTAASSAAPSIRDGGPAATYKYLLSLMETPAVKRQTVTSGALDPAPFAVEEPPKKGSVPSPEPPPALHSTLPATARAPMPPPVGSEGVVQTPPPAVVPLPPVEDARTQELPPPSVIRVETAAPVPAPLAAVDPTKGGPVAFSEPPPEIPSTTPPATAVALLPPPAKSEEIAQPPPPTFLPIPQEKEARTREPTPSQASRMETAAPVPAPLAAVDLSKGGPVAFPEPPPEVPSTTPPATDPLRLEEERLSATKSYRIGPEDVLHVFVWDNPELTIDVTVRPDGKISLPLIKDIQAADFTPKELSDVIFRSLKEYIYNPHVTVTVTQANSRKIFLIGNVIRPGSYMLRHDMTVLQALSLAGGFTQFASPRNMKLIRDVEGKQESRSINYYKMIKDSEVDDYMLKPGDTIVIP